MSLTPDILKGVRDLIPEATQTKIKTFMAKFNAVPPVPPVIVKLDTQVTTQDGTMTLSIAGDSAAIGAMVMDLTSGTPVPVADGTYTLQDGSSITTVAGAITAIVPAPVATPPQPPADFGAQFKIQFAAQEVKFAGLLKAELKLRDIKIAELEATNKDITEINKTVVEFMSKIMETPVVEKKKVLPAVDFSKMSALEVRRYHKAAAKENGQK